MHASCHRQSYSTATIAITLAIACIVVTFFPASAQAAPRSEEYIICSGGPALRKWENLRPEAYQHDRWWGNFIRTARIRMEQLRAMPGGDATAITWLVYRPGYTKRGTEEGRPLVSLVNSVRDKFRIKLIWFNTGDDVIAYLNTGQNRRRVKISGFDYFGHSNRHCFMFDYSCDILAVSSSYLHENELGKIRRGLFTKNAHVWSYGCHTGESMAEKWKRATRVKMVGAVGKTDYSYSWQGTLPIINRGYWKR